MFVVFLSLSEFDTSAMMRTIGVIWSCHESKHYGGVVCQFQRG